MKKITLEQITRQYKNNGQHAEQTFRYTYTHEIIKADNKKGTDLDNIQIKSARATICKGTDLEKYVNEDPATIYAYVTNDFTTAYLMNKTEWLAFIKTFGTVTTESNKNNGAIKTRLRTESREMKEWFSERQTTLIFGKRHPFIFLYGNIKRQ